MATLTPAAAKEGVQWADRLIEAEDRCKEFDSKYVEAAKFFEAAKRKLEEEQSKETRDSDMIEVLERKVRKARIAMARQIAFKVTLEQQRNKAADSFRKWDSSHGTYYGTV